jgi:hypothetical protein
MGGVGVGVDKASWGRRRTMAGRRLRLFRKNFQNYRFSPTIPHFAGLKFLFPPDLF